MDQTPVKELEDAKNQFAINHKKMVSVKKEINNLVYGQSEVINQILISGGGTDISL